MSPEGNTKNLNPGEGVRNSFWGWSRDEQKMYLMNNKRDPNFMDIYKLAIDSVDDEMRSIELIYQNNDGLDVGAISPNEKFFAITKAITSADSRRT